MSDTGAPFLFEDVFTAASDDFTLTVIPGKDDVHIRIQRSAGTGFPLYEVSNMRWHEVDYLQRLLKQALENQ